MRFGLSTRLYLFGGPEELRPEEGLSKLQRRQLAALEVNSAFSAMIRIALLWSVCLSVCLCPRVCLPACLPACLALCICLSVCLHVCHMA